MDRGGLFEFPIQQYSLGKTKNYGFTNPRPRPHYLASVYLLAVDFLISQTCVEADFWLA